MDCSHAGDKIFKVWMLLALSSCVEIVCGCIESLFLSLQMMFPLQAPLELLRPGPAEPRIARCRFWFAGPRHCSVWARGVVAHALTRNEEVGK